MFSIYCVTQWLQIVEQLNRNGPHLWYLPATQKDRMLCLVNTYAKNSDRPIVFAEEKILSVEKSNKQN